MSILTTKRLELHGYSDSDRTELINLLTDESIKRNFMIPDFKDEAEKENAFQKLKAASWSDEHYEKGIYLQGKLIGFVNDVETDGNGGIEMGYVIDPVYQGCGYATEMFSAVIDDLFSKGYKQVIAGAFENNAASMRVMQKCGMHRIEREEDIEYRGETRHCLYYAVCCGEI